MNVRDPRAHSMVIASDYRVSDPDQVWPLLTRRRSALSGIGARHVLLYASSDDYGRVLVTIGVRSREPVQELLRSRVFFDWFDAVGVDDIPAVFAGEVSDRFEASVDLNLKPPEAIVASIAAVDDVPSLAVGIRSSLDRFTRAGVRKTSLFRAFDDEREVMILQELDDEDAARRWIAHPDIAAAWMEHTGIGAYPPVFMGRFVDMMDIDE